jgi:hypothetical protein
MARRVSTPPVGLRFDGRLPTLRAAISSSGVADLQVRTVTRRSHPSDQGIDKSDTEKNQNLNESMAIKWKKTHHQVG